MSFGRTRYGACLYMATLLISPSNISSAQVLAHPGWTRSNFATEPWYQRAVFYQIPSAAPDFKSLAERLDAMQSTGIDAVIVTPPALLSLTGASAEQAIAAQSALDSFDNFTRQATAHGIRVLVAIPAAHADADLAGRIRFWLTRGVAGLRLEIPPDTSTADRAAIATNARTLAAGAGGQRIVLVDAENSGTSPAVTSKANRADRSTSRNMSSAPQLQVTVLTGPLSAPALRPQLAAALASRDSLLDTRIGSADASPLAQVLATIALAANPAALADPAQALVLPATLPTPEPMDETAKPAPPPIPQQPPPGVYLPYVPYTPPPHPVKKAAPTPEPADPLTLFYARLAALHHSNQALRNGSKTVLDFDTENALVWVAKPASATLQNPAVVVLCNLSAQPVTLSLADAMKKLNLHGFFLRKLLRSDSRLGAEDIAAVKLAPYGVFIGELRR
jgi:hypothetical protein